MARTLLRLPEFGSHRWTAVILVSGVVLAASATSLGNGFAYDDIPAITRNSNVHSLKEPWRFLTDTYWPITRFGGGATLYRPMTSLSFAIQWALGGGRPFAFHIVSILLYLLGSLAFLWLAWGLMPPTGAIIAACLFAAHPVHVEAVANVVGQSELLATLFVLLAVGFFLRARAAGTITLPDRLRIYGCYLLACLSKDNGFMLPGILLAAELTVVRDPRPLLQRFRALREFWLVLVAVGLCYLALRTMATGSLAGDYPYVLLAIATYKERVFTMLRVALEWPRLLLWPAHLQSDYSPRDIDLQYWFGPVQAAGLGMLLAALWLVFWTRRRHPAASFGILWVFVGIFPVSNLILKSGVLLAERTLYLPSAGAMLAVGAAVVALSEVSGAGRRVAVAAAAVLVVLGTVRSALRQPVWKDNATLLAATVLDAPRNYHAHWSNALDLFDRGHRELAFSEIATAIDLFPRDAALLSDAGDLHRTAGECEEAIGFYERALAISPERTYTRSRLASCNMRIGRYAEARAVLHRLISEGHYEYGFLLPAVDSAAAAAGGFR